MEATGSMQACVRLLKGKPLPKRVNMEAVRKHSYISCLYYHMLLKITHNFEAHSFKHAQDTQERHKNLLDSVIKDRLRIIEDDTNLRGTVE